MPLNPSQQYIIDNIQGIYVVDAGAGTGKTTAITARYANILKQQNTHPDNILLLTFTENAAAHMRDRIILSGAGRMADLAGAPITTFHAFCNRLLQRHGFGVPAQIGIDLPLSSHYRIMENRIFEQRFFHRFYREFTKGAPGNNPLNTMIGNDTDSLLELIHHLCCRGIFPEKDGWSHNGSEMLQGNPELCRNRIEAMGIEAITASFKNGIKNKMYLTLDRTDNTIALADGTRIPLFSDSKHFNPELIQQAFNEDRNAFFDFIHDIYYAYIIHCLQAGRINFDFMLMFAFLLLYHNHALRERISFDYVMVDEFQDTNEIQFMLTMLLMKSDNLCAVGDWKQGIYSFRHATIDNILQFEEKLADCGRQLNSDYKRINFPLKVKPWEFTANYRSSETILNFSRNLLSVPGSSKEAIDPDLLAKVVPLSAERPLEDATAIRFYKADGPSDLDEINMILDLVKGIIHNNSCPIIKFDSQGNPSQRPVQWQDIAILTRTREFGLKLHSAALNQNLPANFDGGIELYRTAPAILVLAWLRLIINKNDPRGWLPILEAHGVSHMELTRIINAGFDECPPELQALHQRLTKSDENLAARIEMILAFYSFRDSIANAVLKNLSSLFSQSMLSLAELIGFIEDNITGHTTYDLDISHASDALTVQTIHGAKGLEYPIVILANINRSRFPGQGRSQGPFIFHSSTGLHPRFEYGIRNEYTCLFNRWQTDILTSRLYSDYDEERRLLYVAVTRAKQYLYCTARNPSLFFTGMAGDSYPIETAPPVSDIDTPIQTAEEDELEIGPYTPTPRVLGVHDLMEYTPPEEGQGKGREFGRTMHHFAHRTALECSSEWNEPEAAAIEKYIGELHNQYTDLLPEIPCVLPLGQTVIRGVIDLVCINDSDVLIVDYKSDLTAVNHGEYVKQLSVYWHAAAGAYPDHTITAELFYVSQGKRDTISPLSLEALSREAAQARISCFQRE